MRPKSLILAAFTALTLTSGAALAQNFTLPNVTFPEPGTFCGPAQLCAPDVTPSTSGG